MSTLPNFPFKDQRSEPTIDGHPPENGNWDCVPVSFACAIQYLTGAPCTGDELKDAEYGETYQGGTALVAYVDQASDRARVVYHVTADAENAAPAALVNLIHAGVQAGYPVIATIPSQWGIPRDQQAAGYTTHVVCFYSEAPGSLTAMNPWGGFAHAGSDQYWTDRLCSNQVWKVHKENTPMPAGAPTGFYGLVTTDDPVIWYCPGSKCHLGHGFRQMYVSLSGSAFGNGPTQILGLPLTEEYKQADSTVRQDFERGSLIYDGKNINPWMIYFGSIGVELRNVKQALSDAEAKLAAEASQVSALNGQVGALNTQITSLTQQLAEAKAAAGKATQYLASIKQAEAVLTQAASL